MTEHRTAAGPAPAPGATAGTARDTLRIYETPTGTEAATITLSGRLDAVEAPALRDVLDHQLAAGAKQLLVDLSDVTFVDSAGLAVLVRARRETRAVAGDVVLVRPGTEAAMRVFRLTQFDQVFRMLPAHRPDSP